MIDLADLMPFSRLMGLEILEATPTRVTARLKVRADLCTTGGILHGGAAMAMADAMGAVGGFLNLAPGAHNDTGEQDQLPRRGRGRLHRARRNHANPYRARHQRLANQDHAPRRQAGGACHPDPDDVGAGSQSVKTEPSPGVLCARTSPPIAIINDRVITRPSPVPPKRLEVSFSA